jgi:ectoine hydroxylase-related dioxygenase (phytanoyl-CoA dioxygenase family)
MVTQSSDLTADQMAKIENEGYVVIEDVLSQVECDRWSRFIDETWQREHVKPHTYDDEPGVQFVENLLSYSIEFLRLATEPRVLAAVRAVLGFDVRYSLGNARCNHPGYGAQPLHDLNTARGRPFRKCDALWSLDPFTERNGTRILPGSHHSDENFLDAVSEDPWAPHPQERIATAPRGGVLVFNASVIHSGRDNAEKVPRRTILTQFVRAGDKTRFHWSTDLPPERLRQLPPESWSVLGLTEADVPG